MFTRSPLIEILRPLCAVAGALTFAASAWAAGFPVSIKVDASTVGTSISPATRPSVFAAWSGSATLNTFNTEATSIGTVRLSVEDAMRKSTSLSDYKTRLQKMGTGWKNIESKGGVIVITLARMPKWLSVSTSNTPAGPNGFTISEASPPKDYDQWASLVEATVKRFSTDLKLTPRYELWNEPDLRSFWVGTTDDYLKLYKYFVLGARRASTGALVGGPTTSGFDTKLDGSRPNTLIQDLVSYCASTPLPDLSYSKLPLDFLSWHRYSSNPYVDWKRCVSSVKQTLRTYGYPDYTPLFIDEWNFWADIAWQQFERDTEYNASCSAAAIAAMNRAGVTYQAFAALEDYTVVSGSLFHGDFGMATTGTFVRKPAYHAAMMLGRLSTGTQLRTTVSGTDLLDSAPTLEVMASRKSSGEIVVVAWNHIAEQEAVATASLDAKGYDLRPSSTQLALSGSTSSQVLQHAIDDPNYISTLPYSAAVKADLQVAVDDAIWSDTLRVTPLAASVVITNPPKSTYKVERYVVDPTYSNAYTAYQNARKQGKTDAQATDVAKTSDKLVKVESYTTNVTKALPVFSIAPYSVQLLVLTPQ